MPLKFLSILVQLSFFFFNDTATTEIYTLSLHDALPIWLEVPARRGSPGRRQYAFERLLRYRLVTERSYGQAAVHGFVHIHVVSPSRPLRALFSPNSIIGDRKSTRLNSSHVRISYAAFCF